MLYGPSFLPVPLEESQAVARPVGHDGKEVHAAPVGEELPLALGDPEGEVPPDTGPILPMITFLRHVGHLGPLASGLGIPPLRLSRAGRQAADLGEELRREIGADGLLDSLGLTPAEDDRLIQRAVPPHPQLGHACGERGHGACEDALPSRGGDVPIAELVGDHHVLLGPHDRHRLIAPGPVVGDGGRRLVALHQRGVHICCRRRHGGPALQPGDQGAVRLPQAG